MGDIDFDFDAPVRTFTIQEVDPEQPLAEQVPVVMKDARWPYWNFEHTDITEEDFRTVVNVVCYLFMRDERQPKEHEVFHYCAGVARDKVRQILDTELFRTWVKNRGFVYYDGQPQLTEQQMLVLMTVTNPYDKRPLTAKLRDHNVTPGQYNIWMRNKEFADTINAMAEKAVSNHLAQAHQSLLNQVDKGDMKAIQFYYELTGRYNPNQANERDLRGTIGQVIEIITKNVKDPAVLAAIAGEMDAVINGRPVAGQVAIRGEVS